MAEMTWNLGPFTGIEQAYGPASGQLNSAWTAQNMVTRHGRMTNSAGWREAYPPLPQEEPILTLARFYRRNHATFPEVLAAATANRLYVYTDHWQLAGEGYQSGKWDWVCYEDVVDEHTVDILLMTNPHDGMIAVSGHDLLARPMETPDKFAYLARYKERIFGAGSLQHPDRLYYSQPFAPAAWGSVEQSGVRLPELSGGSIDSPTWDGDKIIALRPYGASLLVFKGETVFRLYGADPGEFYLRDQYGVDGPIAEDTVAVDADAVYLLSRNGLSLYDGAAVRPLRRDSLEQLWQAVSPARMPESCALLHKGRYYFTLPDTQGSFLMELDLERAAFMAYRGFCPGTLLSMDRQLLFTDANRPGLIFVLMEYPEGPASAFPSIWITPWSDGGAPGRMKSAFRLSGVLRLQSETEVARLTITLQTERGEKTRTMLWPSSAQEKPFTLRLPCYGRRFRLAISCPSDSRFTLFGPLALSAYLHEEVTF